MDFVLCRKRFSCNQRSIVRLCSTAYHSTEKGNSFNNHRPGIAQNLVTTRASVTEKDLRQWFSYVQHYLEKKNLLFIAPERIFNLDESAFMLVPKDDSVITQKGAKSVYQIVGSNEKACLTVLFVANAAGIMPPPMILFNLKTTPRQNVLQSIPTGWGIGNTERGWMIAESFYSYTLDIPYNEKLEHRKLLCIERERDPLHILLVATRCYAHYIMHAVSLSVMTCE